MIIKNEKIFLTIRFVILIVIPAFCTFYNTIGYIWHLGYTKEITATITALQVFLGTCLEISNKNYKKVNNNINLQNDNN